MTKALNPKLLTGDFLCAHRHPEFISDQYLLKNIMTDVEIHAA